MSDYLTSAAIALIVLTIVFVITVSAHLHRTIDRIHNDIEAMEAELIDIQLRHRELERGFKQDKPSEPGLTVAEYDLIAQVCHTEARGEGFDGMVAVAQVIKNRLNDGRFGKTIAEICTSKQFHGLNHIDGFPCAEAYEATRLVFANGYSVTPFNALYFCTHATNPDAIKKGLKLVAVVGNHSFYTDL